MKRAGSVREANYVSPRERKYAKKTLVRSERRDAKAGITRDPDVVVTCAKGRVIPGHLD